MPLNVGDRLGPYEIVTPIGHGGMGEVYRARDTRIHREVAIKTSSARFTERFEREAQAIAALNHPNVCTLYDVGPDYLVMELVEGPTLADRITAGPIPLDESLKLASQIADALSAAHRKGVIHRDLKPGNIKVKPDGTVKVLDFGLAKVGVATAATSDNSPTLAAHDTLAGVVLGTAAYMSPEQAKGKPVDKNTDIWAFGVVLYEMLTGKQLHQGETVSETIASVLKETPDLSRVPARVRRLLKSCLQKDPEQRLHDIADWRLLLDDDVVEASPRVASRTRWLWPAIAAMLLAVVGVLAVTQLRKAPQVAQEVRSQIPQPEGLTFIPGTQATISPDGKWLAFPALGPDRVSRMYLRAVDALDVRPLAGSEGIINNSPPPFWSYDSRFVVYGAQGKLKKSEITGTPAQPIADIGVPFVQGGTWSREGEILYARNGGNLEQVSSNGGSPTAVTMLSPDEGAHRWPQFLSDGRRFLYLRVSNSSETTGVYVGSLDVKPEAQSLKPLVLTNRQAWWFTSEINKTSYLLTQREETLFAQPFDVNTATLRGTPVPVANGVGSFAGPTSGLWSVARNGALVYRSGGITGSLQPTWVDPTGRVLETFGDPGNYGAPAVSPDGSRLAFTLTDLQGNTDIWVRDLVRGGNTRLTFDPRLDIVPVWSPDSKRIIYSSVRGGRRDLYEKNADGSGEERLVLQSDQDKSPSSWSRDGRFMLFTSVHPKNLEDLWILPLQGEGKPFVFLGTDGREQMGQFSPDQRWIAYSSASAAGIDVFVRPFAPDSRSPAGAGGPVWMVSANGGTSPRWSADGKRLFYVTLNNDMMAVDIQAGVSFQSGIPQRLFNTTTLTNWAMSLSGDRFLMLRPNVGSGPPPPFTLVLNWTRRLEQ